MSAIRELLRVASAIFVELGWFFLAILVALLLGHFAPKLYSRIKPLLRSTFAQMYHTDDKRHPPKTKSPPVSSNADLSSYESALPKELLLQHTIDRLQARSSQGVSTDFDTIRLKEEVLKPLSAFLLDLKSQLTLPKIEIGLSSDYSAKVSEEERDWNRWNEDNALREMPSRVLRLKISIEIFVTVIKADGEDLRIITIEGWFPGEDQGKWSVSHSRKKVREFPMYDWYALKQYVSGLLNDILVTAEAL